ncbi:hypothetical protein GCM10022600_10430 [Qipengyuania pelagi]
MFCAYFCVHPHPRVRILAPDGAAGAQSRLRTLRVRAPPLGLNHRNRNGPRPAGRKADRPRVAPSGARISRAGGVRTINLRPPRIAEQMNVQPVAEAETVFEA